MVDFISFSYMYGGYTKKEKIIIERDDDDDDDDLELSTIV